VYNRFDRKTGRFIITKQSEELIVNLQKMVQEAKNWG
jgi:hypothetical protein